MFDDAALALEEIAPEEKTRSEVLGARVAIYLADEKWDMAAEVVAFAVRLIPQDALAELFSPATALSSPPMAQLALHHVNLIVTDLPRSLAFYQNLFGLRIIERPPFKGAGAWLACGDLQVHLTLYPSGSFRTGNVNGADSHFAFRTDDFEGALATLTVNGFREDAEEDDPMRVMVRRDGPAGFPQLFLLDPDRNIIEINSAP